MQIQILPGYSFPDEIRQLFTEYTTLLTEGDPQFREYLRIQNYDAEIAHLEDKYGQPDGRLYLALANGRSAGCIALRKLNATQCEMKRLYVRPEYHSLGIGKRLTERILLDARSMGYRQILLDTFPFLDRAIGMYRRLGFRETDKYNDSPMASTVYLKLEL